MPRPARSMWVTRTYARRRHRSWMLSMSFASLGWGAWWVALFLSRVAPGWVPSLAWPGAISTVAAVLGLGVALLTLRAQRSWLLFVSIPFFANLSLLFVPWLAAEYTGSG